MKNLILSAFAAAIFTTGSALAPALADHNAPDHNVNETQVASETLYSGVWTKKTSKSSGDWSIVKEGDKTLIKLSGDFKTRNAPDLKIFLSPLSAAEANGKNATNGSLMVAPLSSNAGAQTYEIPTGLNLAAYKSILIHCEAYAKLWSAADL